jgi:hypothetical protein
MTITDLHGNKIAEVDSAMLEASEYSDDSNINVFEFANVLLAGLLPTFVWVVSALSDLSGDEVSVTDVSLNNSETYDSSTYEYDNSSINYEGVWVEGTISDLIGISLTVGDIAGGLVSEEDVTEVVMLVTDFLSNVNEILDIEGTSLSVSEWGGDTISVTEVSLSNSFTYDFSAYTYNNSSITYDGVWVQGTIVDISGS